MKQILILLFLFVILANADIAERDLKFQGKGMSPTIIFKNVKCCDRVPGGEPDELPDLPPDKWTIGVYKYDENATCGIPRNQRYLPWKAKLQNYMIDATCYDKNGDAYVAIAQITDYDFVPLDDAIVVLNAWKKRWSSEEIKKAILESKKELAAYQEKMTEVARSYNVKKIEELTKKIENLQYKIDQLHFELDEMLKKEDFGVTPYEHVGANFDETCHGSNTGRCYDYKPRVCCSNYLCGNAITKCGVFRDPDAGFWHKRAFILNFKKSGFKPGEEGEYPLPDICRSSEESINWFQRHPRVSTCCPEIRVEDCRKEDETEFCLDDNYEEDYSSYEVHTSRRYASTAHKKLVFLSEARTEGDKLYKRALDRAKGTDQSPFDLMRVIQKEDEEKAAEEAKKEAERLAAIAAKKKAEEEARQKKIEEHKKQVEAQRKKLQEQARKKAEEARKVLEEARRLEREAEAAEKAAESEDFSGKF